MGQQDVAEVSPAAASPGDSAPLADTTAGTGATPVVQCIGLTKRYLLALGSEVHALTGLDLSVNQGETFAIVGPNGSGKTTTLKLLLGLIFPSEGEAYLLGESPRSRRAKRRIGFVPEGPFFYQHMTGEEVVRFYGRLCGLRGADLRDRTNELLQLVGMSKRRDVVMSHCSKGMVQRVGLASALVNDPDLVLMDEPTSGLDPIGAHEIKNLIVRLRERGKTVLLCSHLLEQVEEVCDRIAILHRGRKLADGRIEDILQVSDQGELVAADLSEESIAKLTALSDDVARRGGEATFLLKSGADVFGAVDIVRQGGGRLLRVEHVRESLEEAFIRAVTESSTGAGPLSTDAADSAEPPAEGPAPEDREEGESA